MNRAYSLGHPASISRTSLRGQPLDSTSRKIGGLPGFGAKTLLRQPPIFPSVCTPVLAVGQRLQEQLVAFPAAHSRRTRGYPDAPHFLAVREYNCQRVFAHAFLCH